MADQLTKRKRVENDHPWPEHWTVRFSWDSPFGLLHNKKHEFQVKGDRTWYTFLKFVHNRVNDKTWVDAVCETGFRAFKPESVVKVRDRKPVQSIARRNSNGTKTRTMETGTTTTR